MYSSRLFLHWPQEVPVSSISFGKCYLFYYFYKWLLIITNFNVYSYEFDLKFTISQRKTISFSATPKPHHISDDAFNLCKIAIPHPMSFFLEAFRGLVLIWNKINHKQFLINGKWVFNNFKVSFVSRMKKLILPKSEKSLSEHQEDYRNLASKSQLTIWNCKKNIVSGTRLWGIIITSQGC